MEKTVITCYGEGEQIEVCQLSRKNVIISTTDAFGDDTCVLVSLEKVEELVAALQKALKPEGENAGG